MKISIKYFDTHPRIKAWGWFILLWCGGLASALLLAYPIKLLMNLLK